MCKTLLREIELNAINHVIIYFVYRYTLQETIKYSKVTFIFTVL